MRSLNRTVPQQSFSGRSIGDFSVCSRLRQRIPNTIQNHSESNKPVAACWAPGGIAAAQDIRNVPDGMASSAVHLALDREHLVRLHHRSYHTSNPLETRCSLALHKLIPSRVVRVLLFHRRSTSPFQLALSLSRKRPRPVSNRLYPWYVT